MPESNQQGGRVVFPAGRLTQSTPITPLCSSPAAQTPQKFGAPAQAQAAPTPFPAPPQHDRMEEVHRSEYTGTYVKWIPPAAISRHSVCPVAALWIPASPVAGKQALVWRTIWRAAPDNSQGWVPHLNHRNDGSLRGVLRGTRTRHSFLGSTWFGFSPGIRPLCSSVLFGDVSLMGWWPLG